MVSVAHYVVVTSPLGWRRQSARARGRLLREAARMATPKPDQRQREPSDRATSHMNKLMCIIMGERALRGEMARQETVE